MSRSGVQRQRALSTQPLSRILLIATLPVLALGSHSSLAAQNQGRNNDPTLDTSSYFYQGSYLTSIGEGLELLGDSLTSMDGVTSGFRLTAGFTPMDLPLLDIGAELDYRESEEVPFVASHGNNQLVDTTSIGGSLLAGVRMGNFGMYAKSGYAGWQGEVVTGRPGASLEGGMARVNGFGAHLAVNGIVSRLNYERFDEPSLSHLNMVTASIHIPF